MEVSLYFARTSSALFTLTQLFNGGVENNVHLTTVLITNQIFNTSSSSSSTHKACSLWVMLLTKLIPFDPAPSKDIQLRQRKPSPREPRSGVSISCSYVPTDRTDLSATSQSVYEVLKWLNFYLAKVAATYSKSDTFNELRRNPCRLNGGGSLKVDVRW